VFVGAVGIGVFVGAVSGIDVPVAVGGGGAVGGAVGGAGGHGTLLTELACFI